MTARGFPLAARWPTDALTIDRARLRGGGDRAALDRALDGLSADAVGVPPGALLLIARLVAPVCLGPATTRGAFGRGVASAVRAALDRARAAGTADGARFFADEAAFAAWVIGDWLRGARPSERAATVRLLGTGDIAAWTRRTVVADGGLLPRVIAQLARDGLATTWLARLDDGEIALATAAMARTNGIVITRHRAIVTASARRELARLVPELAVAPLAPPARGLLALALALARRPAWAATPAAIAAIAAAADTSATPVGDVVVETSPVDRRTLPIVVGTAEAGPPPARVRALRGARPPAVTNPTDDVPPTPFARVRHPRTAATAPTAAATPALPAAPPVVVPAFATEFGGLFFLLNAALALGLYGDFTVPRATPLGLSPFDLLEALGRGWFGAAFAADALADAVPRLSGRPAAAPAGDGFVPPPWSVPDAWLTPWPPATPVVRRAGAHPWHPAGFPLAAGDTPAGATAWLHALRLYLAARLGRALALAPQEAVVLTARRPATVADDRARLTVTFALAAHPVALRLAGLDRDPGWLPAAGRDIRFVFE